MSGYNSRTIQDIVFKFSAFLSAMEATKCVKFQNARCKDFQVDIFRISPIVLVEERAANNWNSLDRRQTDHKT